MRVTQMTGLCPGAHATTPRLPRSRASRSRSRASCHMTGQFLSVFELEIADSDRAVLQPFRLCDCFFGKVHGSFHRLVGSCDARPWGPTAHRDSWVFLAFFFFTFEKN